MDKRRGFMLKNTSNTPKVEWADNCFSWNLIDRREFSLKMEEIPPGGSSDSHFHASSFQFFFILEGKATIELEGIQFKLKPNEGIEIPFRKKHQITNSSNENLRFLLISCPRIEKNDICI